MMLALLLDVIRTARANLEYRCRDRERDSWSLLRRFEVIEITAPLSHRKWVLWQWRRQSPHWRNKNGLTASATVTDKRARPTGEGLTPP